jgi:hypothetical protein
MLKNNSLIYFPLFNRVAHEIKYNHKQKIFGVQQLLIYAEN